MKFRFYSIGKLRKPWATAAVDEYLQRLNPHPGAEIVPVLPRGKTPESTALLNSSQSCYRIALDGSGKILASRDWASALEKLEMDGHRIIAFLIGDAGGHDEKLIAKADAVWSFGKLTLPHELALVVAVEQLYRASSIRANAPYHRE